MGQVGVARPIVVGIEVATIAPILPLSRVIGDQFHDRRWRKAEEEAVTAAATETRISDEQLLALTPEERGRLARRLAALTARSPSPFPSGRRRRGWLVVAAVVACAAVAAWIFALAEMLPARYVVGHWDAAWIGFDVMLLISFACIGWTAWRRISAVPMAALVSAVLLVCDAWFDLMTASGGGDVVASVGYATVELPLAAGLSYLAYRKYRAVT
jgi:hypothetical protein